MKTTMVHFRAAGAAYCIPVTTTKSVRLRSGMITLPAPGLDIAGILPGNPPMTVICPLGSGGAYVLVLEAGDKTFGLLVDEVTGLRPAAEDDITPPPDGQNRSLICGTIDTAGQLVLVTNADALVERL